jgi:WD40 repeat protein
VQRRVRAAAHLSMSSPSVYTDVAAETSASFNLEMKNLYSWRAEESMTAVRSLCVNETESLFLTSSKAGIKVWGLSCNPIQCFGSYTRHSFSPFRMCFLRSSSQVASSDGNINVWDLETQTTIGYATPPKVGTVVDHRLSSSRRHTILYYVYTTCE